MGSSVWTADMAGQVTWTVLAVVVTAVRSQDSYGSPSTAVLNPTPASSTSGSSNFGSATSFSSRPSSSSSSFGSAGNIWASSSSDDPQNLAPVFNNAPSPFSSSSSGNSYSGPSSNSFSGSSSFGGQSEGSSFGGSTGPSFGESSGPSFGGSSGPSFGGSSGPSFGGSSGSSFGGSSPPSHSSSSSGSNFGSSSSGSNFGSSSTFGSASSSATSSGSTPGGIDFSQATRQPDGRMCVIKEASVETVSKDPILECRHKEVEKCHYTYTTYFRPAQEETCQENYEKKCQITFKQEAIQENVRKCYRPVEKVCNGQGPEQCRTVYESSCTTRYLEAGQGKFVGDTKCDKLPVKICGAGCVTEEGPEECHDKLLDTLVEVPEETCDLNPQKTCRLVTKLVPSLKPKQECTTVPQEICHLKFTQPKRKQKPLRTEWCLAEETSEPQTGYGGPRSGRRFGSSG